jgi:hypothetical protein
VNIEHEMIRASLVHGAIESAREVASRALPGEVVSLKSLDRPAGFTDEEASNLNATVQAVWRHVFTVGITERVSEMRKIADGLETAFLQNVPPTKPVAELGATAGPTAPPSPAADERMFSVPVKCPVCDFTQTVTKSDTPAGRAQAELEARTNIGGHLTSAHPATPIYMASEKCGFPDCSFIGTAYDVDTPDGRDRATEASMDLVAAHALAEHGTVVERISRHHDDDD